MHTHKRIYTKCSFTHHRVFIAICNGGVEIGRVNAFAPDYSKAKVAAAKLFALFDRESLIDPTDTSGKTPVRESDRLTQCAYALNHLYALIKRNFHVHTLICKSRVVYEVLLDVKCFYFLFVLIYSFANDVLQQTFSHFSFKMVLLVLFPI